jgi:hypothetical protein
MPDSSWSARCRHWFVTMLMKNEDGIARNEQPRRLRGGL